MSGESESEALLCYLPQLVRSAIGRAIILHTPASVCTALTARF